MTEKSAGKGVSGPARILLVDDEVRNLDALEELLNAPEYSVVRATSAETALRELLHHDYAAILMDVRMPRMNGIELARMIKQRERSARTPILFLTAQALDKAEILEGYEAGAVDYLTKPVDAKILKTKIEVFVDLFKKRCELMQAEESLRKVNAELEARVEERTHKLAAALKAKDDFLAALSHELRTPLNPVLLIASDAAHDPSLAPDVRERFSTIQTNVELEARLIDDLLDLTRISHGKLSLKLEPLDLSDVVKAAVETLQAEFNEKRVRLTVDLQCHGVLVNGDTVRLRQVLWNILKNAVKFTPPGGVVEAKAAVSPDGDQVFVSVTDSGIGLTESEISFIFEAFRQGDHVSDGSARRFGGLGLGLTISKMLAELHQGTIRASSPGRGKGSTFQLELPIFAIRGEAAHEVFSFQNSQGGDRASETGTRILLVEDHEPTRTALTHLLSRRRYDVLSATCIKEAHQIASQEKLDLVISDIGLPDGDGYSLMSKLRQDYGLKGIALSGYGMEADRIRSSRSGFVGHLVKPIRINQLDELLKAYSQSLQA